jgi:hypothetical protein
MLGGSRSQRTGEDVRGAVGFNETVQFIPPAPVSPSNPLFVGTPQVNPNPGQVGIATTFSVQVTGGAPPYTYQWSNISDVGIVIPNVASYTATPNAPNLDGDVVQVTVTDSQNNQVASPQVIWPVESPPPIVVNTPVISPSTATVNQTTVSFSVSISGGVPPYTIVWNGLPTPCTSTSSSFSCIPNQTGTFNISVTANDAYGDTGTSPTASLTVNTTTQPLTVKLGVGPNPTYVGQAFTATATASGGTGGYSYSWSNIPGGCSAPGNVASWTCNDPTQSGSFTITVKVTDSSGNTASINQVLTINPFTASAPSISPNPTVVGQSTTFSTTVTGGATPYTYTWNGLPAGITSSNSNPLTGQPSSAAGGNTYNVSVTVVDNFGNKVTSSTTSLTVNTTPLSAAAPTISPNPDQVAQSTKFTANPAGGSPPYTFVWNNLPAGCSSTSQSFSCSPTQSAAGNTFSVSYIVTDSASNQATSSATSLTVNPCALTTTLPTISPSTITLGASVSFSTTTSCGIPPYSYIWNGLPSPCSSQNTNSFSCTPNVTGTFNISVTVKDSTGVTFTSGTATLTVNPSTINLPTKVAIVVFENQASSSFLSQSEFGNLASTYAQINGLNNNTLENYWAICHPSAPNYLAMITGEAGNSSNGQCGSDNFTNGQYSANTIVDLLESANKTWKGYFQNIVSSPCTTNQSFSCKNCTTEPNTDAYASRHNPFVMLSRITNQNSTSGPNAGKPRCNLLQDYSVFLTDGSAGNLPNFSYVVPNLCNDAHDCPTSVANNFLSSEFPKWSAFPDFTNGNLVIFIVADESGTHGTGQTVGYSLPKGCTTPPAWLVAIPGTNSTDIAQGGVLFIAVANQSKGVGIISGNYSHYNLLVSTQALLGITGTQLGFANPSCFPKIQCFQTKY